MSVPKEVIIAREATALAMLEEEASGGSLEQRIKRARARNNPPPGTGIRRETLDLANEVTYLTSAVELGCGAISNTVESLERTLGHVNESMPAATLYESLADELSTNNALLMIDMITRPNGPLAQHFDIDYDKLFTEGFMAAYPFLVRRKQRGTKRIANGDNQ